ncbi:YraN family protein [Chthonobacter rhizosphaerae]|uniref:YraN family protein n=1 Tax=Chthonobacter rhizosphaerae TaxID=2735553 RepID=UPI0015EFC9C6
MTRPDRVRAYRRGLFAEAFAAWLLRLKGYRIIARRHRTPVGEIDLVALRGRVVVFVEVKARHDETAAGEAVTAESRRRIVRAAGVFLNRNRRLAGRERRFDVVAVLPGRWPRHHVDAFQDRAD